MQVNAGVGIKGPKRVEVIPRVKYGSDSDSEPITDLYGHLERDMDTEQLQEFRAKLRPFAGKGRKLSEVIPECWRTWRNMMVDDAKKGLIDAQVDYGMSLWRGDANMRIEMDRRAGFRWIAKAVAYGQHCIFKNGGCGASTCHKCNAIVLKRKMEEWFKDEEVRTKSTSQYVVLHTPNLIFNITSFLDVKSLFSLRQVNHLFKEIIGDKRSWAHLDLHKMYPSPHINFETLRMPFEHCRSCKMTLKHTDRRMEAVTLPSPLDHHFIVCMSCFEQRAKSIIQPYTLHGAKLLHYQWELKNRAIHEMTWETHCQRKLIINDKMATKESNQLKEIAHIATGKASLGKVSDAANSTAKPVEVAVKHVPKVITFVKSDNTNAKNVFNAIKSSASIEKSTEKSADKSKGDAILNVEEEDEDDDDDDIEALAAMLIGGESVSIVTEKDKQRDLVWQSNEGHRISQKQAEQRERDSNAALMQEQKEKEIAEAVSLASAANTAIEPAEVPELPDMQNAAETTNENNHTDDTLATYLKDFAKHRKHMSRWDLYSEVVVEYPTHACTLYRHGDDPDTVHFDGNLNHVLPNEENATPALPLLYELLQAQWKRASGLQFFKLRDAIQRKLLRVIEQQD